MGFHGLCLILNKKKKILFNQGWGAGKFFAAPAPDFFFKRLRLLIFSQATPAPGIFFERLRLRFQGAKKSGSWLLVKFGKIFFSPQTSKVKLQKI